MSKVDSLSNGSLNQKGQQSNTKTELNSGERMFYPAIVVPGGTTDPLDQNRIRARIVTLNSDGTIKGKLSKGEENYDAYAGKDQGTADSQLPLCMPLLPEILHVRPIEGEMVYVLLENSKDQSSPRYWIGPIISSKLKLQFQSYEEAVKMFNYTNFSTNQQATNKLDATSVFPGQTDVALQGRNDADLMLKQKEAYLVAGKFNQDNLTINTDTPSYLQLKQFIINSASTTSVLSTSNASLLPKYSQANLTSTNINIYSPRGKFMDSTNSPEVSSDLISFGSVANTLHPSMFGDEGIILFDLIINILLNHIHTPQDPLLPTPESKQLQTYTLDGNLQNLISNCVRIN